MALHSYTECVEAVFASGPMGSRNF